MQQPEICSIPFISSISHSNSYNNCIHKRQAEWWYILVNMVHFLCFGHLRKQWEELKLTWKLNIMINHYKIYKLNDKMHKYIKIIWVGETGWGFRWNSISYDLLIVEAGLWYIHIIFHNKVLKIRKKKINMHFKTPMSSQPTK